MRLIDADELLENNTWDFFNEYGQYTHAGEAVKNAPTIEPKRGRWIKERVHNLHNGEKRNARECSECGAIYFVYDMANAIDEVPRYCPNCGARMDGEENG